MWRSYVVRPARVLPEPVSLQLLIVFLLLLAILLSALPGAYGEPFYLRRDHTDQDKYNRASDNINVVRDLTDAEFVLSKYGYLLCQSPRRKREAVMSRPRQMWSSVAEGVHVDGCQQAEVEEAIRSYQLEYDLPQTGMLDQETRSLMSTSRCGNKDHQEDNPQTAPIFPEASTDDARSGGASSNSVQAASTPEPPRLWRRRRSANRQRPSQIISTITGKDIVAPNTARSLGYHENFLKEFITNDRISTAVNSLSQPSNKRKKSRILRRYTPGERRKRSVHVWMANNHKPLGKYMDESGQLFNKETVRWRLLTTGFSTRIPVEDQRATMTLAFRYWSEVIPLKFVEDHNSDIHSVDIEIAFGRGSHQNCEHDFDGNGGEIAHSFNVGDMHFDDDESFRSIRSYSPDGIYLLRVAVHEIGHVLGLAHTNKSQSIMYAIYRGTQVAPQFELSRDDRKDIQQIYGVCKGMFNTVFDWVREAPDREYIYNSYFFRDNHYWMYENHANRTRYGDPLYIAREWKGVPNRPDGYVHVWLYAGRDAVDEAFFFKGAHYYKYDNKNDKVMEGWPRLIKDDFGPKEGHTEAIPDDLDSTFFDARDRNIYFFKNEHVYVYDPVAPPEEKGCCVRKTTMQEEFPALEGSLPLPSKLDAVYYSYRDKMMYFLAGEDLWRNKLFDPRQRRNHNGVEYMGKWYDKWLDICDVVPMENEAT